MTADRRPRLGRVALAAAAVPLAAGAAAGCLDPGEPVPGPARVTWVAYPETVLVGETFTFEMAGPLAPDHCVRLDTTRVAARDSVVRVSAGRSVFPDAMCSDERRSFYEVRPLRLQRAGAYPVRTDLGLELGTLVAVDSGAFSGVRTIGEGTLRAADGCVIFSPGWSADQRLFALAGLPEAAGRVSGTDSVVRVEGTLRGYSLCGAFGSVPTVQVSSARTTGGTGAGYYPLETEVPPRGGAPAKIGTGTDTARDTARGAP